MATKLKDQDKKKLLKIGITSTTEEDATAKILAFLAKNDVDNVEEEPLSQLIEMAEVFYDDAPAEVEDDEEAEDEEAEEEAEEDEDEEPTPPVVVKKSAVKAVVKAAPVVAKKPAAKTKVEEIDEDEEMDKVLEEIKDKKINVKKPVAAPAKAVAGRKTELNGDKWDGRNNKAHDAMIKGFRKRFNEKEFQIDLLKQGFTVRVLGANAKTTIMNFDEVRIDGGKLVGNFYCNRFKNPEDLLAILPEQYQAEGESEKNVGFFRGESHPCIRKVTEDELMDILDNSEFLNMSLSKASTTDIKMGKNREKLEESITKPAAKKTTPVPAAKKPAPVQVEIEEEEELEETTDDVLSGLDRDGLKAFIKDNDLSEFVKVFKSDTEETLREKISTCLEQLSTEEEVEEEVEEEEAPAPPAKKAVKK